MYMMVTKESNRYTYVQGTKADIARGFKKVGYDICAEDIVVEELNSETINEIFSIYDGREGKLVGVLIPWLFKERAIEA